MQVILATDHAGFKLKNQLKPYLQNQGYKIIDVNPKFQANDDYPLIAQIAAKKARAFKSEVILICGSGAGMAMAANRFKWMRVVQAIDLVVVKMSRVDEDANGLALSARRLSLAQAKKLVDVFLNTSTSSAARHKRRQRQLATLRS